MSLSSRLALGQGAAVAVVGAGGKTTVVQALAKENRQKKVLISPTTQIALPTGSGGTVCTTTASCLAHTPHTGIQTMGIPRRGKLGALPPQMLAQLRLGYQLTLMEADGSKELPCKGWAPYEPVVPSFTTHTVGVLSIRALGLPATGQHVHRLPLFLQLTGLAEGQPITLQALARMACEPGGMFKNAKGHTALLINQAEAAEDCNNAILLAQLIRNNYPTALCLIARGSAQQNHWLWEEQQQ